MIEGTEITARECTQAIIENLGYELVDVQFKKIYGNPTLTFFIYKKGGVTLEDCETVSNAIESVLDEADITNGAFYHLNVSSLGLDRPIITDDDYRRNVDEEIEIVFKDDNKRKKTHGILISYDNNTITLKENGKNTVYEKNMYSTARPYINFK